MIRCGAGSSAIRRFSIRSTCIIGNVSIALGVREARKVCLVKSYIYTRPENALMYLLQTEGSSCLPQPQRYPTKVHPPQSVASVYPKVTDTPRSSRTIHLSCFIQPRRKLTLGFKNMVFIAQHFTALNYIYSTVTTQHSSFTSLNERITPLFLLSPLTERGN